MRSNNTGWYQRQVQTKRKGNHPKQQQTDSKQSARTSSTRLSSFMSLVACAAARRSLAVYFSPRNAAMKLTNAVCNQTEDGTESAIHPDQNQDKGHVKEIVIGGKVGGQTHDRTEARKMPASTVASENIGGSDRLHNRSNASR